MLKSKHMSAKKAGWSKAKQTWLSNQSDSKNRGEMMKKF